MDTAPTKCERHHPRHNFRTATVSSPHARRWLKAYSSRTCSIAAFSATSSTRFFELPTATLLCRDLDPPPTFAASCSHPATAWLPVPGSHPSRRISPSRHRSCVSISPLLEQHLPPYALPPAASTPRSSALPYPALRHTPFPLPRRNHTQLRAERGDQVTSALL